MPQKVDDTLPPSRRLTAVELFCGAGGMALGFERAGFDILAAVELDPVHLAAHERNFPLCEPLCSDVSHLSGADVLDAARRGWERRHKSPMGPDGIDCLFGGPSCQGFSVIGRRDPSDQRNGLVHEFVRLVVAMRPKWFVLENVPGLVSPAYRAVLREVYATLEAGGYCTAEPWVLNACDYGVPQDRKRVFIVGARDDQPAPEVPTPATHRVTVSEALDDLPPLTRFRSLLTHDGLRLDARSLEDMRSRQSPFIRQINGATPDPDDLSDPREWNPLLLTSVGLTAHSDEVRTRFQRLKPGARDKIGRLPKLDSAGQSPTLRAGTGPDHGSFTSARPVHHRNPRVISVREAARLHSFPDWFGFHATRWHGFRQVGNAVPPLLAFAVAQSLAKASRKRPARRKASIPLGARDLLTMNLTDAADRYGLPASMLPQDVRRAVSRSRPNTALPSRSTPATASSTRR